MNPELGDKPYKCDKCGQETEHAIHITQPFLDMRGMIMFNPEDHYWCLSCIFEHCMNEARRQ